MSLGSTFNAETLERLAKLELNDFIAFSSAITLGYSPVKFYEAVTAFAAGNDPKLPSSGGQAQPLTINAWSFVNDHGQYAATYGLTDVDALNLKNLLVRDKDEGVKAIDAAVVSRLQQRGSTKPVRVSLDGMPGDKSGPGAGKSSNLGAELKKEIASAGGLYGRYKFEAVETPFAGPHAFCVPLGKGFSAYFANKRGAVDVARIARVRGRFHALVAGYVGFLAPDASQPAFGDSIPKKADWDCILGADAPLPPAPTSKAKTNVEQTTK